MIAGQVASRYSRALFKMAASKEELEIRQQDLEGVVSVLQSLPKLGQFLSAPQISRVDKEKVLEKSLGGKLDPQLLHFMLFLLEKGRLKHLPEISRAYQRMVKESLGILEASLITAVPADTKIKESLQRKREKAYKKSSEMREEIDPQIMGGVILVVANQVMDWSIRDRLSSLKENLWSASV